MSKRVFNPAVPSRKALTLRDLEGAGARNYKPESLVIFARLTGIQLSIWKELCKDNPKVSRSKMAQNAILALGALLLRDEDGKRLKITLPDPDTGEETSLRVYLGFSPTDDD